MRLSGLEPMDYIPNTENMRSTFLYIGERCNVAGSSIYKKVGRGVTLWYQHVWRS
jgi:5-methyltetrahydrofolate--homocysteine methyltransferase